MYHHQFWFHTLAPIDPPAHPLSAKAQSTSSAEQSYYLSPLNYDLPPTHAKALAEIDSQFHLSGNKLQEILKQFLWEFDQGLKPASADATVSAASAVEKGIKAMPMIPTFVQKIPTGKEEGTYLALDLGGTNLRVCEVVLLPDSSKWRMKQQKYKVSQVLKEGPAEALFDYIAASVDQFLTEIGTEATQDHLFLGLTFSFPVAQTKIDAGTLINWTKGFKCSGAVGEDVVQLLQKSLDKKHIHVKVVALVNDTAGTLMARAYESGNDGILCGGIFGTGTNGAYVENVKNIGKGDGTGEIMIINTEWGAFDNERIVLPFTHFDNRVDRISINPRKQAFEKMISGMYLGEVTRNVILHLVDSQVILKGRGSEMLNRHYGLDTAIMSALESPSLPNSTAATNRIAHLKEVITKDLGIEAALISDADAILVARVSEIVGERGCRLSACALAAVAVQTGFTKEGNKQKITFGLDGSLVEFYPRFEERIRGAITELLGSEVEGRFELGLAKDGSGIGAALCAQAASQ